MRAGRRFKRVLLAFCLLLAALVVFWCATPLWFRAVLRPAARKAGAHYQNYQPAGYGGFVLDGFGFTNADVSFQAGTVEALTPETWLTQLGLGRTNIAFLRVKDWKLELLDNKSQTNKTSTYSDTSDANNALQTLSRWLPEAALDDGEIVSGSTHIKVANLRWHHGEAEADVDLPNGWGKGHASGQLLGTNSFSLLFTSPLPDIKAIATGELAGATLRLGVDGFWQSNHFLLDAEFGSTGGLPRFATLEATNFQINAQQVGLKGYQSLAGSAAAGWTNGLFVLALQASAQPPPGENSLPPLSLELYAHGDTNSAVIDDAAISSAWAKVDVSRGARLFFSGPMLRETAKVTLALDLSKQDSLALHGKLTGDGEFQPGNGKLPVARFNLAGINIGRDNLEVKDFAIQGSADLATMNLEGWLQCNGVQAQRFLPAGYSYEALNINATFQGPLTNLTHSGSFKVTKVGTPFVQPFDAVAHWRGISTNQLEADLDVAMKAASLQLKTSATMTNSAVRIALDGLALATNGQPALVLSQPAAAVISLTKPFHLELSPLQLAGPAGKMDIAGTVTWPAEGSIQVSGSGLNSELLTPLLKRPPESVALQKLAFSASWSNGPVLFDAELAASALPAEFISENAPGTPQNLQTNSLAKAPVFVSVSLAGNENGLTISNLTLTSGTSAVLEAHGILPLQFVPADATNMIRLERSKPLEFTLNTRTNSRLWQEIQQLTGLGLKDPNITAAVSGRWDAPQGDVRVNLGQLDLHQGKTPPIDKLQLHLRLDRSNAKLVDGRFFVSGQPVTITGDLPLGEDFFNSIQEHKTLNWSNATVHVQAIDAQIAAFTGLAPKILSPQGEVTFDFSLSPGAKLAGFLSIRHGRTRPMQDLGPLRDINVKMVVKDWRLQLEEATARVSSSEVQVTGDIDLRGTNWLGGELPPFRLNVRGTRVPLSQQPESIIRSDLDITLSRTNREAPLISGTANLRDSYFLSDLSDLVPGKVASAQRRPPYFSITEPLLAGWRLGLHVTGDKFMKVRSTLFNGVASANVHLEGTLKDPIATGDVKIDSGAVRFPFASLEVQRGFVTLTSQDPYHPQLSVAAASKQYGYDVRMDLKGPADAPVIQFSSTPPLTSEQILLMVTAGEIPSSTYTLTTQQKAQTFAMFLGKDVLAKLGFGDQSEPRLIIRSGEEISETGKPTYYVEYRLTDRWSIVGEYDRFGYFDGGFKWRVYSK
ncbi:MAG TPA: translocation/assembly module TamB domain-containing protein [Candidatus Dormibacteraeota bacterium]|nr:translocation/assembly module TamB domain-containing protein [Candidatus Dormibacteraeota bacterium]